MGNMEKKYYVHSFLAFVFINLMKKVYIMVNVIHLGYERHVINKIKET